ncbi:MAG: phosphoethanolamine transferase [Panacagrimonas sp.]
MERGRALLSLMRRHPVLTGSCLVGSSYGLMEMAWADAAGATLVYCLGARLLMALSRSGSHGHWLSACWNLAFVIDLGVKAFLATVYKSPPDAVLVIEAISNTNSDESAEFLLNYWQLLGAFTLQLSVLAVLLLLGTRPAPEYRIRGYRPLLIGAVVFGLLHLHPTVRRANPVVFWTVQAATIEEFRANVDTLDAKREQARAQLPQWQPRYTGPARHTMGLVIGESTNRWNWQLYGYSRATTPHLMAQQDQLLVFRDVISAASSTVSSLRYMLTPRSLDAPGGDEALPSVLMLAREAGYKIFWISNQHDRYLTTRFAGEADVVHLLNRGGVASSGLETRSLDERLLPAWREALVDPAPRKLIVAHLLGAHAHYDLRSPADFQHFEASEDEVDHELAALGRPAWVRLRRDQYDDAMLYQDWVISQLLGEFRSALGTQSGAWLYTSDHAEEVGHTRNFTGHSPDEAGQVVPLLIWRSSGVSAADKARLEARPYQTDVLDWTVLNLLKIQTRQDSDRDSLLSDSYLPPERRLHDGTVYRSPGDARTRAW